MTKKNKLQFKYLLMICTTKTVCNNITTSFCDPFCEFYYNFIKLNLLCIERPVYLYNIPYKFSNIFNDKFIICSFKFYFS